MTTPLDQITRITTTPTTDTHPSTNKHPTSSTKPGTTDTNPNTHSPWTDYQGQLMAAEVLGAACFFAALIRMDFANAQAILQVVPFAVTLGAALFLGERVGARQYLAIASGFVGVLIVVRPATDGFTAWSLMAVAAAAFIVAREFATRSVPTSIPATSLAFVTALGLAALTAPLSTLGGWGSVDGTSVGWILGAVVSLTAGYYFTIETVRVGDLSVAAPFRYSALLAAVLVGFALFAEVPDRLTLIGGGIIIASGLYGLYIDRRRSSTTKIETVQPANLPSVHEQ